MKNRIIRTGFLCLLLALLVITTNQTSAQCRVTGLTSNASSWSMPIHDVKVTFKQNGVTIASTQSVKGRYNINVPAGTYQVIATGYTYSDFTGSMVVNCQNPHNSSLNYETFNISLEKRTSTPTQPTAPVNNPNQVPILGNYSGFEGSHAFKFDFSMPNERIIKITNLLEKQLSILYKPNYTIKVTGCTGPNNGWKVLTNSQYHKYRVVIINPANTRCDYITNTRVGSEESGSGTFDFKVIFADQWGKIKKTQFYKGSFSFTTDKHPAVKISITSFTITRLP